MHRLRLWRGRRLGSSNRWYLPEHFSAEWDRVNYEPYSEAITDWTTGQGAAGAFNEKSNIFSIGRVSLPPPPFQFLPSCPLGSITTHNLFSPANQTESVGATDYRVLHATAAARNPPAGNTFAADGAQHGKPGLDLHGRDEVSA
jgi:hypothetical protein